MFRSFVLLRGLLLALALTGLLPALASAHERRALGPYTVVVGFTVEPAIEGQPNGVDFRVTRTDGNTPVEGVQNSLKVQIAAGGGAPKEYALRTRFGMPGAYTADLIPTQTGAYTFQFVGTIDGTTVNERFESGPGRFNDVTPASTLHFPEVVPSGLELKGQIEALNGEIAMARSIGIGGAIVGALGLIAAGIALVRRPDPVRSA